MVSASELKQLKAFPIAQFLATRGVFPVLSAGPEWLYISPLRIENTPSFSVNTTENVFYDFGGPSDANGDLIRLIQLLDGCTFRQAVATLEALDRSPTDFSFSGQIANHEDSSLTILAVKPLRHLALVKYANSRKIPFELANRYLVEVHYQNRGKSFFALGFRNDKGGFELRSQQFKGSTRPKSISSFVVEHSAKVCLFEGFFDFLSAMVYFGRSTPKYTTIILNSTANTKQSLAMLQVFGEVNTFLDSDPAGQATNDQLKAFGLKVNDYSRLYHGFKDFNHFLICQP